jgi:signal transduction histidine kinase
MSDQLDSREERGKLPAQLDLTLLANFVHQVVNPLNGVAGTLDNLSAGIISEARAPQRLKAARAQIEHCISLLRNLAFLAKASTEDAEFGSKIVVLPQVIIEAAMYYQEEAETKKIRINLQDRQTQNSVNVRPELLRQVIMNILDNCVKYSKFGSAITIDQRIQHHTGDAVIEIRSIPAHRIPQDEFNKIFDLGFRGSNAKLMIASGTGLGLTICRQILELFGGYISVQTENDGLLFTVKVPGGVREADRAKR